MILSDREYEHERKRVKYLFDWFIDRMRLRWWAFDIDYERGESRREDEDGHLSIKLMRVWTQWQYADVRILVFLGEVAELSDDKLMETVLHELMHVFVAEMRADPEDNWDHEERVVTSLARGVMALMESYRVENPLVQWKHDQLPPLVTSPV